MLLVVITEASLELPSSNSIVHLGSVLFRHSPSRALHYLASPRLASPSTTPASLPTRELPVMAAIDPTKVGKYPVILSPELLGKPSKETYTGIRYNHRPTLSSDTAPNTAHLKKSAKDGSYNIGFDDKGDRYQYNGVRTTEDGNYALIFDPKRQAFILHRVDSIFHMNLTRTPTDNVETLRDKFPQLEIKNGTSSAASTSKPPPTQAKGKAAASKAAASKFKEDAPAKAKAAPKSTAVKNAPSARNTAAAKGKGKGRVDKKAAEALFLPDPNAAPPAAPSLPMPSIPEKKREAPPPKKKIADDEDEEDDDDDDFGLTIEYPDAKPPPPPPAASLNRRFSEFGKGGYEDEEERDPEEGFRHFQQLREESDEDEEYNFEEVVPAPSAPVSSYNSQPRPLVTEPETYTFDDESDEDEEADVEADPMHDDLEAELEAAFGEMDEDDKDNESEVSEEE
ncbi:RNA polymerase II transcription elongation factor-domain-containing protein [Triangularia setosa]|uniref:RNA polymerase II transcription elongation factor-domain-containing protein n=1 Tax=Triangularia setosa TaxID=2587417 RepID=A0AAN7A8B8_9PEZI|nr:RNA polymerase II transcription elongation factor-domain-containing protein [Podospora setosa]